MVTEIEKLHQKVLDGVEKFVGDETELISQDVVVQRRDFYNSLIPFLLDHDVWLVSIPKISKHEVDLFNLYSKVQEMGGYDKVTRWKDLCSIANSELKESSSGSRAVRKMYDELLLEFEWHETGQTEIKEQEVAPYKRPTVLEDISRLPTEFSKKLTFFRDFMKSKFNVIPSKPDLMTCQRCNKDYTCYHYEDGCRLFHTDPLTKHANKCNPEDKAQKSEATKLRKTIKAYKETKSHGLDILYASGGIEKMGYWSIDCTICKTTWIINVKTDLKLGYLCVLAEHRNSQCKTINEARRHFELENPFDRTDTRFEQCTSFDHAEKSGKAQPCFYMQRTKDAKFSGFKSFGKTFNYAGESHGTGTNGDGDSYARKYAIYAQKNKFNPKVSSSHPLLFVPKNMYDQDKKAAKLLIKKVEAVCIAIFKKSLKNGDYAHSPLKDMSRKEFLEIAGLIYKILHEFYETVRPVVTEQPNQEPELSIEDLTPELLEKISKSPSKRKWFDNVLKDAPPEIKRLKQGIGK